MAQKHSIEPSKIFAGKLPSNTTEEDLKKTFSVIGTVTECRIVTRRQKPLGYGFVSFDKVLTETDLEKVKTLNDQEIVVEHARPQQQRESYRENFQSNYRPKYRENYPEGYQQRDSFRGRSNDDFQPRSRGGYREDFNRDRESYRGGSNDSGYSQDHQRSRGGYRGGYNRDYPRTESHQYRGNYRGGYDKPVTEFRSEGRDSRGYESSEGDYREHGGYSRGYSRGGYSPRGYSRGGYSPRGFSPRGFSSRGYSRGGYSRGGYSRGGNSRGESVSETTLFVANLPYDVNEEELMKIFEAYEPKKAHIARYKGRSKGYGFIEVANQDFQLKALQDLHLTKCQERELTVKISEVDLASPEELHS